MGGDRSPLTINDPSDPDADGRVAEDILVDYYMAKALAQQGSVPYSEREYRTALYLEAVLKKHGVTQELFDSSLVYYYSRADRFDANQKVLKDQFILFDYNKVGEVEIFGYYTSPTIENAIKKNIIRSTIVIDTRQMGRYSIAALNEYRESGYVSELYFIDVSLVNADDVSADSGEGGQSDEEE